MAGNNKQKEFADYLERYLSADRETRVKAKSKADILNAAEKAGFSKKAIKDVAALEKLEAGERQAQLRTLILYANYAGHTDQMDMFDNIDFAQLAMEVDAIDDSADVPDQATKDIEEAVAEADAEVEAEMEAQVKEGDWEDPANDQEQEDAA